MNSFPNPPLIFRKQKIVLNNSQRNLSKINLDIKLFKEIVK